MNNSKDNEQSKRFALIGELRNVSEDPAEFKLVGPIKCKRGGGDVIVQRRSGASGKSDRDYVVLQELKEKKSKIGDILVFGFPVDEEVSEDLEDDDLDL